MAPFIKKILKANVRILLYYGDTDMVGIFQIFKKLKRFKFWTAISDPTLNDHNSDNTDPKEKGRKNAIILINIQLKKK